MTLMAAVQRQGYVRIRDQFLVDHRFGLVEIWITVFPATQTAWGWSKDTRFSSHTTTVLDISGIGYDLQVKTAIIVRSNGYNKQTTIR